MANCFREISEFDDVARNGSARGSSEGEDVNESPIHSTVNIGPSQACRKMNIKDTLDCLLFFFCLVSLNINGMCCGVVFLSHILCWVREWS